MSVEGRVLAPGADHGGGALRMDRSAVLVFAVLSVVLLALLVSELQWGGVAEAGRRLAEGYESHKDLVPLDNSDYYGTTFVVLGLLIAASGGIGGGGIIVPLLILVYGFSPKHAIPLSNFTIVGSSITNMLMNIPKRHPDADRLLVDWDLILVMEPLAMAGAIVGAFTSKVLPDWILFISLMILLAFTSEQTLRKGISQWMAETKQFEGAQKSEQRAPQKGEMGESEPLLKTEKSQSQSQSSETSEGGSKEGLEAGRIYENKYTRSEESLELRALLESERATPWEKVKIVSLMVAVVMVLNLLKGGGPAFPSPLGIECGSSAYWMMTAVVFVWVLSFSLYMRSILIEKWRLKTQLGYRYIKGDVEWNPTNTIVYPCVFFFAGFFAGLFGVGGGIVKGPLMLQMGLNPLVASGTVAVMIMYTSVAATTMFIAFGTLTWDYACFLFVVGLLSTVVGQYVVFELVRKYKHVSLVSLSIGAVCLLSTLLMGLQSVFSLIDMHNNPDETRTSTLCGSSQ